MPILLTATSWSSMGMAGWETLRILSSSNSPASATKNDREIYEGDIVRVWIYQDEDEPELNESKVCKVVWCGDDYPAFDLEPSYAEESNSLSHIMAGADGETIEVIGNIHENPELLK